MGAINEKILAAREAGMRTLLIPKENIKDIPCGFTGLNIVGIENINEAYHHVFAS